MELRRIRKRSTRCAAAARSGGRVVLITNAPRTAAPIMGMLDRMGVPRDAYDGVVSSGDVTRAMIAPYRGKVVHHIGPPTEDDTLYEGLGVIRGRAEDAEAVVVTDLDTEDDTPEMYRDRMQVWLRRRLPLICANPDRVVEHGGRLIYCGGALADLYEAQGGRILMAGKPYRPIYDEALKRPSVSGRPCHRPRANPRHRRQRPHRRHRRRQCRDRSVLHHRLDPRRRFRARRPRPIRRRFAALVAPTGARLVGFAPRLAW